ncbi:hypothetical protein [Kaistia granuli]|uniref:hypothetical protein n=1 Tax=Kaistia granuli TaxID=363259 RepID=UPI000374C945|nr:hypothetical protein [Kaistia granuli]
MDENIHPVAIEHLPFFITAPGQTDILFNGMVVFMLVVVLVVGNLYFQLHAFPERLAHRTNVVQMEFVAVLALISLFTHNHLFWIAGLLLALIRFPDFSTPMASIAGSLEKLAGQRDGGAHGVAGAAGPPPGISASTSPEPSARPVDVSNVDHGGRVLTPEAAPGAPASRAGN